MENSPEQSWDNVAAGWKEHIHSRHEAKLYRDHILHPMLLHLIGDVTGQQVLDAGCGEGYLSRLLGSMGAKVTGIDISDQMLQFAREQQTEDSNVIYKKLSLTDLSSLNPTFNLVVCNLVLNIIPLYQEVFTQFIRVLEPNGSLVVALPHPCFDGVGAGQVQMPNGELRWSVNRYIDEVSGRAAHGAPTFHRPLSAYINAALDVGFVLTGFLEPVTPEAYSKMFPDHVREFDRLPSLIGLRFKKI